MIGVGGLGSKFGGMGLGSARGNLPYPATEALEWFKKDYSRTNIVSGYEKIYGYKKKANLIQNTEGNRPSIPTNNLFNRQNALMYFDYSNNNFMSLDSDLLAGKDSFTISIWMMGDYFQTNGGVIYFGDQVQIFTRLAYDTIAFRIEDSGGGTTGFIDCPITSNQWAKFDFAWDGSKIYIFKNGEEKSSLEVNGSLSSASTRYVGYFDGEGYYSGWFDNLQIYDYYIGSDQIERNYKNELSEYKFIGDFKFETTKENADLKYRISNSVIDAQKGNKSIGCFNGYLYLSEDNSNSFIQKAAFENIENFIEMSWIFDNGVIVFATSEKIYRSIDNLSTYQEMSIVDTNGDPVSITASGNYFKMFQAFNYAHRNNREELIWGNYTQNFNCEINIYWMHEDSTELTVIYQFAPNPCTGQPGDSGNTLIARHIQGNTYNSNKDEFWIQSGDFYCVDAGQNETKWIKITESGGVFTVTEEYDSDVDGWYQGTGFWFDVNDNMYYASESTDASKQGIFKIAYSDLGTPVNWTEVSGYQERYWGIMGNNNDQEIIACHGKNIIYSKNLINFNELTLDELNSRVGGQDNLVRIFDKNNDGYYKLQRSTAASRGFSIVPVIFVKIK